MPGVLSPEQMQQMQAIMGMMAAGGMGGMAPPQYGGAGYPAPVPGVDPTMAQAYAQALQSFLHQSPAMPFPGMGLQYAPPAPAEPTVSVSVEGMKFQYQLTEDDLHKVFKRYGTVKRVIVDDACSSATVTFQSAQDAQSAISDLDGKVLNGLDGTLRISWANQAAAAPPYPGMGALPGMGGLGFPQAAPPWGAPGAGPVMPQPASGTMPGGDMGGSGEAKPAHVKGARKYTCRFLIGIENDKEFQVARRLIGSKGSNMKRIVRQTEAKLRLRGVGSGYFEGAGQKESSEPLQLCVSCVSQEGYKAAVRQVEELLLRVYDDYRQFCRENNMTAPDLQINLSENQLVYSLRGNNGEGAAPGGAAGAEAGSPKRQAKRGGAKSRGGGRGTAAGGEGDRGEPGPNAPPVEEIERLISERNEARRACNFSEADRIRESLHSRGVALMDEPGGRGKGTEVTTWRYWRD